MKSLCLIIALFVLAPVARADQFSYKLFTQNEGKTFLGRNTLKGGPCTLAFFNETMLYTFWKDVSAVRTTEEAYAAHMSSISPGHFLHFPLSKSIGSSTGGPLSLSCLIMGRCEKSKLQLKFKNLATMKSLEEWYAGKLTDRCEF